MIDLHLHFDGSLLPKTVLELAKEQGIKLPAYEPEELKNYLTVPMDCQNLEEYLACFDLPLMVLQTKEGIRKAMYTLVCSLKEQGMLYVEIRFAPQLHTTKGLTQEEVVQAAAKGLQEALAGSFFKAGLILCCMRGTDNHAENMETIETAAKFLGRGVVAADIAGEENAYPLEQFEDLFVRAKELGVPYTIHASEEEGPEGVRTAIRFGTKRIGHGVKSRQDPEVVELLIREGIFLESCPTSNLQTKSVSDISDHPVLDYLRQGIKVTLNTDNMTVSDTTVEKEFRQLEEHLGLTPEEKKQMLLNSVDAAFLSEEEKGRLRDVICKIV
ncbi:MAG: adenosine deaminase [Lachnospiraceae bacterium]|nr:adenosine deaminase [Lachnospiraceae bacterium]